jgi:hypothetical protein
MVITTLLVIALRMINALIHAHPEIKESHSMMKWHLSIFVFNETIIFVDTTYKICWSHGVVNLSKENNTMVEILLNLISLSAECAMSFYISYLMVKLCTPADLAKQKLLLKKIERISYTARASESELFLTES